jgi:hypothetical protein
VQANVDFFMQVIFGFFNHPLFIFLGGLFTLLVLLQTSYTIYLYAKGVIPVLIRLGMGLSQRKIAVFAETDEFNRLKSMLLDSGILRESNIVKIEKNSLKKAKDMTIFLVHWKSFKSEIDGILTIKDDSTALFVYAPQSEGRIDDNSLEKINQNPNATIVNFRGRLLSDILIGMITTNYKTK